MNFLEIFNYAHLRFSLRLQEFTRFYFYIRSLLQNFSVFRENWDYKLLKVQAKCKFPGNLYIKLNTYRSVTFSFMRLQIIHLLFAHYIISKLQNFSISPSNYQVFNFACYLIVESVIFLGNFATSNCSITSIASLHSNMNYM